MRSGFRGVARPPRDRLITADIPDSMRVHAGRCRAERFHRAFSHSAGGISLFRSYVTPFSHRNRAGTSIIKETVLVAHQHTRSVARGAFLSL